MLAGAAAFLLLLMAGAGVILKTVLDRQEPHLPAKLPSEIAYADARKVWPAHPDYARLQQLRAQSLSLEMELEDLQELPLLTVQPPETDSQPFKDSVWQKNAQTVIGGRVQLERERKQIEEDYREATRAAYEAQRAALDDEYLNDILNINLKAGCLGRGIPAAEAGARRAPVSAEARLGQAGAGLCELCHGSQDCRVGQEVQGSP